VNSSPTCKKGDRLVGWCKEQKMGNAESMQDLHLVQVSDVQRVDLTDIGQTYESHSKMCQTFNFITNSSNKLPWLPPTDVTSFWWWLYSGYLVEPSAVEIYYYSNKLVYRENMQLDWCTYLHQQHWHYCPTDSALHKSIHPWLKYGSLVHTPRWKLLDQKSWAG
jgi:hypothetical protein